MLDISNIKLYGEDSTSTTVIDAIGNALAANRMPLKSLRLHNCEFVLSHHFYRGFRHNTTMTHLELTPSVDISRSIGQVVNALDPTPSYGPLFDVNNTTLEVLNIKNTAPRNFNDAVRYAHMLGNAVSLKEIHIADWATGGMRGYELEHIIRVKNICRKLPGMEGTIVHHSTFHGLPTNANSEDQVIALIEKQNLKTLFSGYFPRDKGQLHFITPQKTFEKVEALLQQVAGQELQDLSLEIEHLGDNHLIIKASDSKLTSLFKALEEGIELLQKGRLIKSARKSAGYTPLFIQPAPSHSADDNANQKPTHQP